MWNSWGRMLLMDIVGGWALDMGLVFSLWGIVFE